MCMIIFNLFQSRYCSVFLPGFYKVFEIVTPNLARTLWHCQGCTIKMVLILSFIEVILKMVFYLCGVYFEVEVSLFCDVALKLIFRNKKRNKEEIMKKIKIIWRWEWTEKRKRKIARKKEGRKTSWWLKNIRIIVLGKKRKPFWKRSEYPEKKSHQI